MFANVGDLFDPRCRFYPFEGPQWRLTAEPLGEVMSVDDTAPFEVMLVHVQLALFYHGPSAAEIAQVDSRLPMEFALIPGQHAMVLAFRFEGGQWADGSWQAALQSEPAGLPDPGTGNHIAVWVPLIDADTGILRTYRLTTWPPQFAAAVRDAINTQLRHRATAEAGYTEIEHWMNAYPTPTALVQAKASLIVRGGTHATVIRDRRR